MKCTGPLLTAPCAHLQLVASLMRQVVCRAIACAPRAGETKRSPFGSPLPCAVSCHFSGEWDSSSFLVTLELSCGEDWAIDSHQYFIRLCVRGCLRLYARWPCRRHRVGGTTARCGAQLDGDAYTQMINAIVIVRATLSDAGAELRHRRANRRLYLQHGGRRPRCARA